MALEPKPAVILGDFKTGISQLNVFQMYPRLLDVLNTSKSDIHMYGILDQGFITNTNLLAKPAHVVESILDNTNFLSNTDIWSDKKTITLKYSELESYGVSKKLMKTSKGKYYYKYFIELYNSELDREKSKIKINTEIVSEVDKWEKMLTTKTNDEIDVKSDELPPLFIFLENQHGTMVLFVKGKFYSVGVGSGDDNFLGGIASNALLLTPDHIRKQHIGGYRIVDIGILTSYHLTNIIKIVNRINKITLGLDYIDETVKFTETAADKDGEFLSKTDKAIKDEHQLKFSICNLYDINSTYCIASSERGNSAVSRDHTRINCTSFIADVVNDRVTCAPLPLKQSLAKGALGAIETITSAVNPENCRRHDHFEPFREYFNDLLFKLYLYIQKPVVDTNKENLPNVLTLLKKIIILHQLFPLLLATVYLY